MPKKRACYANSTEFASNLIYTIYKQYIVNMYVTVSLTHKSKVGAPFK